MSPRTSRSEQRKAPNSGPSRFIHTGVYGHDQRSNGVNRPDHREHTRTARRTPQWVCWCLEEREEKPTRVPYVPSPVRRASSTDLIDELVARLSTPDASRANQGARSSRELAGTLRRAGDRKVPRRRERRKVRRSLRPWRRARSPRRGRLGRRPGPLGHYEVLHPGRGSARTPLLVLGARSKGEVARRDDYRRRTISCALASLGETYDWGTKNGGTAARP